MPMRQFPVVCALFCLFCASASPAEAQEVSFRTAGDFGILVEGSIGGFEGRCLLLDTGSERSVIDRRLAAHLPGERSLARVVVVNKLVRVEQVVLPSLTFGPVRISGLSVLIEDLSPLDRAWGGRIDGIIGMDVLMRQNFAIDFVAHRIRFGPLPALNRAVRFRKDLPYVVLSVKLDGHPVELLFDTGMKDVLIFDSRVRDWGSVTGVNGAATSFFVAPESRLRLRSVPIRSLRLGTENLGPWDVLLAGSGEDSPRGMDGFLGAFPLHPRQIAFDFENGVFSWSVVHGL